MIMSHSTFIALFVFLHCLIYQVSPILFSPLEFSSRDSATVTKEAAKLHDRINSEIWKKFTVHRAPSPCFVTPSYGKNASICGLQMATAKRRPVSAFLGIKYGVAERFKPSKLNPKYWEGRVLEVSGPTTQGSMCVQMNFKTQKIVGVEDCLFLNVFTPTNPTMLPVMVFIHGGSFLEGSSLLYSPSYLLNKDIILVTINYRLGPFGFFNLDSPEAPGNAGLSDQINALKWVQAHIEDFGGDKNKVTLVGHSAGSASANYLMMSPLAKGLFHQAILQSGSAIESWSYNTDHQGSALELSQAVGCTNTSSTVECMKKVSPDILIPALLALVWNDRASGKTGLARTSPSKQTQNKIVAEKPTESLQENKMIDIPLMLGTTKDEGSFPLIIILRSLPKELKTNAAFLKNKLIPDFAVKGLLGINDPNGAVAKSFQSLYCEGVDLGNFQEAMPCFINLFGTLMFKAGIDKVASYSVLPGRRNPTYLYSMEAKSNQSLIEEILSYKANFDTGVSHGDDLMYLFPLTPLDEKEAFVSMRMVELWTNFVIYGNPTPSERGEILKSLHVPKWMPYNRQDQQYMEINHIFSMEKFYSESWY